jgi:hypothetical protein
MEVEANDTSPFLDILFMKRGLKLTTKVYQKPTHIGRHLHFKCNDPRQVKRGVAQSLVSTAKVTSQDRDEVNREIKNMKHEYPQQLIDSIMKPGRGTR